jgi:two-component system nitrogen regulation response regulator GlnG
MSNSYSGEPSEEYDLTGNAQSDIYGSEGECCSIGYETVDNNRELENIHAAPSAGGRVGLSLDEIPPLRYHFGLMIGESPIIRGFLGTLHRVLNNSVTILIQGESGTGKDLVARAIHYNSRRRLKPFVKVNSAALNPNLLESELFGHERGAFTGAHCRKIGRFEAAHGGTIFLDEIDSLDLSLQAKLLRVIEHKEFERVGSNQTISVDVRIITATNRDLTQHIREKKFRKDLYYRINTMPLRIPPLRERKEDIPLLVTHLVQRFNSELEKDIEHISPGALRILLKHPWPGNIRELENVICQAMLHADGDTIRLKEIASIPLLECGGEEGLAVSQNNWFHEMLSSCWAMKDSNIYHRIIEEAEKRLLYYSLLRNEWNIKRTCRSLGISRNTLKERLRRYGLRRPEE